MAIAIKVAKATAWRLVNFPFTSCRDIPMPPPPTLKEMMDNTVYYAKKLRRELKKKGI